MFFRLNPECYFVPGTQNGAIYDLVEGNLYALNHLESELIKKCENNERIQNIDPFLSDLKRRCIGNFYEDKVYIEKIRLGSPIQDYQLGRPPFIARAFLEINNTCNRSCWYCGRHGINRNMGCLGCNKWDETGENLNIVTWKRIIDELKDLECNSIIFTGGDLTQNWAKTLEIVNYAGNAFEKKIVILNSGNFKDTFAEDLKNKAQILIQTEDQNIIQEQNLYLLSVDNEKKYPDEGQFSENVAIEAISHDFRTLQSDHPIITKQKLKKVDIFRFSHNQKVHPCLGNSIAISWKGEVLPCPLLRAHSFGNIKDRQLFTFFEDHENGLDKYWNLRLETFEKCKKCEFKYACTDCRALEEALTGDLSGKKMCNYDPAAGTWL